MDFDSFIEGPLLWISFSFFVAGIVIRAFFFFCAIVKGSKEVDFRWKYIVIVLFRFLLPFHKALLKKPIYSALRYIFHICLLIVPIWLSGHIYLWEESRFNWAWTALPDSWTDGMTLVVIFLAIYFLIRRIIVNDIRQETTAVNYLLLIITTLPFITGYFLTHGSLESVAFLADNIRLFHVLSAEILIFGVAFLFLRTRLNKATCTGCASCGIICPTRALSYSDNGNQRTFYYSLYPCINCGACVGICPEKAAGLYHNFGLKELFQPVSKQKIGAAELMACEQCGQLFAPEAQVEMLGRKVSDDYLHFCIRCKGKVMTQQLSLVRPYPSRSGKEKNERKYEQKSTMQS